MKQSQQLSRVAIALFLAGWIVPILLPAVNNLLRLGIDTGAWQFLLFVIFQLAMIVCAVLSWSQRTSRMLVAILVALIIVLVVYSLIPARPAGGAWIPEESGALLNE